MVKEGLRNPDGNLMVAKPSISLILFIAELANCLACLKGIPILVSHLLIFLSLEYGPLFPLRWADYSDVGGDFAGLPIRASKKCL